jgi:hypothetical protein
VVAPAAGGNNRKQDHQMTGPAGFDTGAGKGIDDLSSTTVLGCHLADGFRNSCHPTHMKNIQNR